MAQFEDKWTKPYKPTASDALADAMHVTAPLKPKMAQGARMVGKQAERMGAMLARLEYRDKSLFGKVVAAKGRGDQPTANALARELAELRKVKGVVYQVKLSLEKAEARLSSYTDLGDAVAALVPAMRLMKSLSSSLGRFVPEAGGEVGQFVETLDGFMQGTLGDEHLAVDQMTDAETEGIMQEAAAVAAQSVDSKLPSTPAAAADTRTGDI